MAFLANDDFAMTLGDDYPPSSLLLCWLVLRIEPLSATSTICHSVRRANDVFQPLFALPPERQKVSVRAGDEFRGLGKIGVKGATSIPRRRSPS